MRLRLRWNCVCLPAAASWLGLLLLYATPAVCPAQPAQSDSARPQEIRRLGILLTGYSQNEKYSKFYPYIYEELKNYLSSRGVPLTEPGDVGLQGDSVDLNRVLDRLPELGVRGLVYFRFDANEVGWIWLRLQCFDPVGRLLWEEKTDSLWSGAMMPSGVARAAVNRMQDRLKRRIGKPGLPLRDALVEQSPKVKNKAK